MPRIADVLERESRAVDLEQGDFERLLARRDRRQRNRRIRGAVAIIVALATAAFLVRSIEHEGIPAAPSNPIGAGEVLGGSTALTARNPDSGDVRTIVDAKALPERARLITGAAWSHDRRWVAFRASADGGSGGGGIWVADTVGGAPRQVSTDVGWSPWAWSPTEDQLVVVLGRDVTLFDATTGRETDLGTVVAAEDIEGYAVHELVWSPDGARIAYDGGRGNGSVYSIDVETGEQTVLVRQPAGTAQINDIDWSPDGAHIAIKYVDAAYIDSHKGDPNRYDATVLYMADADGSDVRLVDRIAASQWPVWIPGLSVGTAWSPDGTRLAYTDFSGPEDHQELQVWTVSADGSAPSLVASRCCVSDGGSPVWSPDGSQIAFATEYGGGTPSVQLDRPVANADGTGDATEIDEFTYSSWDGGWYFCFCYG